MSGRYPWYTRVADTVHRLTVLALVGGSIYVAGGMTYQIYLNGKQYEEQALAQGVIEPAGSEEEEKQ